MTSSDQTVESDAFPKGKYERDPEALAWASAKVQSVVDKAKGFEQKCRERGDDEAAKGWRRVAYFVDQQLVGSSEGCVVTGFDPRWPQLADAIYPTTGSDSDG